MSILKTTTDTLLLLYNKRYFFFFFSSRTIKQQRQSTFALKIRFFARITLSLDWLSINQSLKFVFDSNREICDVLLHNEFSEDSINRKYFYITININIRVFIVNNKSIYNTVVTSCRFEEQILRKASTSIFVYNDVQIDLVIFRLLILFRESCQYEFKQNWIIYSFKQDKACVQNLEQSAFQYRVSQILLKTEKFILIN